MERRETSKPQIKQTKTTMKNTNIATFRLTGPANLAECQAHGAIANRQHRVNTIETGRLVLAMAGPFGPNNDRYMAMVGLGTNKKHDLPAEEIWTDFDTEGKEIFVHQVKWQTRPVVIPTEMARACNTNNLRDEDATTILEYILDQV